jgi:sugar/nucleoside kinase (ribokinase family)
MKDRKITISGTGCALGDFLYNGISFHSSAFEKYMSRKPGDGGLDPGKLVFTEELEKFSAVPYRKILNEITKGRQPDAFNVGGPSLVSLIHAAQLLDTDSYKVRFFGLAGGDETARKILRIVEKTPLDTENYHTTRIRESPFTDVFSDPLYDNGNGERTFVNNIGAAWECKPEYLSEIFFRTDIACFGGTALVPNIHKNLTSLLRESKKHNCITVVNTVFDFLNEKNNPDKPWPLVDAGCYSLIDLLIMDQVEAFRISGTSDIDKAVHFFATSGVSSFVITNGACDLFAWSGGNLFKSSPLMSLPVSAKVTGLLKSGSVKGDTTGCGDNFAGGMIASIAWQLKKAAKGEFNLKEALSWGVSSGGFTCFIIGGTYIENQHGEKLGRVQELQKEYLEQIKYNKS